jgi:hypothetical protein
MLSVYSGEPEIVQKKKQTIKKAFGVFQNISEIDQCADHKLICIEGLGNVKLKAQVLQYPDGVWLMFPVCSMLLTHNCHTTFIIRDNHHFAPLSVIDSAKQRCLLSIVFSWIYIL